MTPTDIIRRLAAAGVAIAWDDKMPTCATRLTPAGYTITLGRAYLHGTPEQQVVLLQHEMGHLVRGDCLVQDVDHGAATIAMDSQINESLDHGIVSSLGGVLYAAIRERYPTLPAALPGWRPVYDAIMARRQQNAQGDHDGRPNGLCGGAHAEGDADACRQAHTVAVLRIRADDVLRDAAAGAGTGIATSPRQVPAVPKPMPAIEQALSAITAVARRGGVLRRTRGYARPGRTPELRGVVRQPTLRVGVAVDASGSMTESLMLAEGVALWLARRHTLRTCAFQDEAMPWRPGTAIAAGGGTLFQPVYRWAASEQVDALLMITDGIAPDIEPLPSVPVVWAITPGGTVPRLRGQDRSVRVEG
jgi:hypothetical protein